MANKIHVIVYDDRNHVGKLSVLVNGEEHSSYEVAAQAANQVHPPVGNYKILNAANVPSDHKGAIAAFGSKIIYLIKKGSNNQNNVIVIHGGKLDADGRLFPTEERGLRVSNESLYKLLTEIRSLNIDELEIEEKHFGFLKHFTTSRVSTMQPSRVRPTYNNYNTSYSGGSITDDPFFWMWLYDENFASSQQDGFAGFGGGSSGGGGATGSFDSQNGDPVIVDPFGKQNSPEIQPDLQPTFATGAGGYQNDNFQQEQPAAQQQNITAGETAY